MQFDQLKRREFITLLLGGVAARGGHAAAGDAVIGFLNKIVPAPANRRNALTGHRWEHNRLQIRPCR